MNEATLEEIVKEISPVLLGQRFGKVFPLSKLRFAIDFRLSKGNYFFLSLEPSAPRIHLIKRNLRDLERQSLNPHPFLLTLRKRLSNSVLRSISKDEGERIVRLRFSANDEIEGLKNYTLIIQLTGRSANLLLLDENDFILDALRENQGEGQTIASLFGAPMRVVPTPRNNTGIFGKGDFVTLSEALDSHFRLVDQERDFQAQTKSAEGKLRREISKRENLQKKLLQDLQNHGQPGDWKRLGDLLLANLVNAVRIDDKVLVTDYFDHSAPIVEIEVPRNLSLTEAAEKFFKRYTRARNAGVELEKRLQLLKAELLGFEAQRLLLEQAVVAKNVSAFLPERIESKGLKSKENKRDDAFKGARRYLSSDGWDILVGKASKDNDFLTFRIAKSLDFWLHAADYGGSHVVIRNPQRASELPARTLVEAAQLAAYYSRGKDQPKAAVNFTQKKFVNKPKGAAAGLVSLSSFKTILVEPNECLEKI